MFKSWRMNNQEGQSLLEVIVVIAVGTIVITALVFATIIGLRNAEFSKNQSVATKFAQEGLESIKGIRDRDQAGSVRFSYSNGQDIVTTSKFSDLWNINLSEKCNLAVSGTESTPCYMKFSGLNRLDGVANSDSESDSSNERLENGNFIRQVQIRDGEDYRQEKIVTVIVKWTDFSGDHESKLTTILRKI